MTQNLKSNTILLVKPKIFILKREGAVVTLFETKTTRIQLKKELQH